MAAKGLKPGEVVYTGKHDATCYGCGRWQRCVKLARGWFCLACRTPPRLDAQGPRWKPWNPSAKNPAACECGATVKDQACFCDSNHKKG